MTKDVTFDKQIFYSPQDVNKDTSFICEAKLLESINKVAIEQEPPAAINLADSSDEDIFSTLFEDEPTTEQQQLTMDTQNDTSVTADTEIQFYKHFQEIGVLLTPLFTWLSETLSELKDALEPIYDSTKDDLNSPPLSPLSSPDNKLENLLP